MLRIARRLVPILMAVVLVSYVAAFARLALSLGELFPGVTLTWRKELKLLTVGPTPGDWPGIRAGLALNDRILCIGGYRPNPASVVYGLDPRYAEMACPNGVKEYSDLYRELDAQGEHSLAFTIDRQGQFLAIPAVPLVRFTLQHLLDLLLTPVLLSAGFLAIGAITLRANPQVEVNLLFAQWVTISAAFLAMDAFSPAIGERLRSTPWAVLPLMTPWIPFWGVSLFHLAGLWATGSRSRRFSRRVLPIYYALSAAAALGGLAAYLLSETALGRALDWPYLGFVAGSAVLALGWSFGLLGWNWVRSAQRRERWRYGSLLGALLVVMLALLLPRLGTFFTAAPMPAFLFTFSYAALLSVAVMAYAIVRFQVMPVQTRGLESLALLVFCILVATAVALLLNNHSFFTLALAISLLTAFGLQWGGRLPFLARVLRREQYDYATLVALERQIGALQPAGELLQTLATLLRRYLDVDHLSAWLATEEAGRLIYLPPGGGRAMITVTPEQAAALAGQREPVAQAQPAAGCFAPLQAASGAGEIAIWAALTDRGELLGVLGLGPRWTGAGYDGRDLELVGALARQVALALANTRQIERLAEAAARLQEVQERERLKIAREIHDTILPFLLVLTYGLDSIRERTPAAAAELEGWQDRISLQAAELRGLLAYLRAPELLVQQGLADALAASLAQVRTMTPVAITADLDAGVDGLLSDEGKVAIYRACREAVNNALKHAHATRIEVRLWQAEGGVAFCVRDDGEGFDAAQSQELGSKGYSSLQDMCAAIEGAGGVLAIRSTLGLGTEVCGTLGTGRSSQEIHTA